MINKKSVIRLFIELKIPVLNLRFHSVLINSFKKRLYYSVRLDYIVNHKFF